MISRRKMLAGAATVVVAPPIAAEALPARVIEKAEPLLHFIPCDGRQLRICDYPELFEVLKPTCSWSADLQMFRVPDSRSYAEQYPVLANDAVVLEDVISTGLDLDTPAGTILFMEKRDA